MLAAQGFTDIIYFTRLVKVMIFMKYENRKELDCMREAFSNIPSLKKFEISGKTETGFTASVELEGGCDFFIHAHFEGYSRGS